MTAYATMVVLALAALAARGFAVTAATIAVAVVLIAVVLDANYVHRRHKDRVLTSRHMLDEVVRVQWLGIGAAGLLTAVLIGGFSQPPLLHAAPEVQALVVGLVVGATTIYMSSLIDWYWILPRVSGLVGVAPCERAGGKQFVDVTKLWLFHRALAITTVTFLLAGIPGYLASTAGGGTEAVAWVVLGTALAGAYNSVNGGLAVAFRYALSPRLTVGDIIRVRASPEDAVLKDAYVVDVSLQGCKYMPLEDIDRPRPMFTFKGDLVRHEDIATIGRARHQRPPCPGVAECRAVNWYCFRNPVAYATTSTNDLEPVAWCPPAEPTNRSLDSVSAETSSQPSRVFISHAVSDAALANDLAADLRTLALDVWVDANRAPQESLGQDIRARLDEADVFVMLISAESQHSSRARHEMTEIVKRVWDDDTKAVVPVLIGSVSPPGYLRDKPAVRVEPEGSAATAAVLGALINHPAMRGIGRTDAGEARLGRRLQELESRAASFAEDEERK